MFYSILKLSLFGGRWSFNSSCVLAAPVTSCRHALKCQKLFKQLSQHENCMLTGLNMTKVFKNYLKLTCNTKLLGPNGQRPPRWSFCKIHCCI